VCDEEQANMGDPVILAICPTARDRMHFTRPEIRRAYRVQFQGTDEATHEAGFDARGFLDDTVRLVGSRREDFAGVVGIDDFPACMLAALVAEKFGFSFPSVESVFLCQHKYYSRLRQREATPEATPAFFALPLQLAAPPADIPLPFPVFIKPTKSYLSILARRIESAPDLCAAMAEGRRRLAPIAAMFDALVATSSLNPSYREISAASLLVEEPLSGHQVTLDGYVYDGTVVPLGVVDSLFVPGTLSFDRFEYPSRLPPRVQERMARIAERCIRHIGLDRTFFDIEFFYRGSDDSIWIIEVNGRMSSQFAPLYRMVDGIDLYGMQFDMALGRDPGIRDVWGPARKRGRVAASFVLRSFEDKYVRRVPHDEDLQRLRDRFPEAFVEILVAEGRKLSDELQDDESFRYALVDLCADDWSDLAESYREALALLPFAFESLPQSREARPTLQDRPASP
jgi:hypothetical protein